MTQFKENTAFYYPEKDEDDSSQSPADQVTSKISKQEMQNNAIIDLTEGKISDINYLEEFMSEKKNVSSYYMDQTTSGRTLNVPKELKPGLVPMHTFNGARTTGELCEGGHCAIPNEPKSSNYVSQTFGFQYISTPRPGNNTEINPETMKYMNKSSLNYGPFNITVARDEDYLNKLKELDNNNTVHFDTNESLASRYAKK